MGIELSVCTMKTCETCQSVLTRVKISIHKMSHPYNLRKLKWKWCNKPVWERILQWLSISTKFELLDNEAENLIQTDRLRVGYKHHNKVSAL